MSALAEDSVPSVLGATGSGSLLRAEARRFSHRRFIRLVLLLSLGIYIVGVAIAWTQYSRVTPALIEQARSDLQGYVDESNAYREQCLANEVPPGENPDNFCPPPATLADYGDPLDYLPKQPFDVAKDLAPAAAGIGFALAAAMFVIGATWIGAEWSTRSLVALLFWEPRRLRVIAVKLVVLTVAVAAVAAVFQGLWLATGFLLGSFKGTTAVQATFWSDLLALQGRVIVLAVLSACGGFALTNLMRNTGAALGVGFVYFAVIETLVRVLKPAGEQFLITANALALSQKGGWDVYLFNEFTPSGESKVIHLSNAHGALVLGVAVGLVLIVGLVTFRRRDLT